MRKIFKALEYPKQIIHPVQRSRFVVKQEEEEEEEKMILNGIEIYHDSR